MKYKHFHVPSKIKFSKKEEDTFVDKDYLIFLTFPIKYINNKKLNTINKRYPMFNISVCYSKNATKNSFFHCFFRPEDFVFDRFKDKMSEYNENFILLFKEIEQIKKSTNNK